MKNLLIVANDFPFPISGGNIRMFKLIKYLSRKKDLKIFLLINKSKDDKLHEIDFLRDVTIFFTNDNSPIISDIVYKRSTETCKLDYFKNKLKFFLKKFIFVDKYLYLWVFPCLSKYFKILNNYKIDYVITTSPTVSTHFFALFSKIYIKNILWIADFRDLWFLSPEIKRKSKITKFFYYQIEKLILIKSDYNIFVSNSIKEITINNFKLNDSNKCHVITNGFDPDDFNFLEFRKVKDEIFQIGYFGTIYDERQNNCLCETLIKYKKQLESEKIIFLFFGEFNELYIRKFDTLIQHGLVVFNSNLNHKDALNKMSKMDALLLILTNSLEGKIALTGKFFEYIKIGKPVLALVPENSEVSNFVTKNDIGITSMPDNIDEIYNSIIKIKTTQFNILNEDVLNNYSRENTSELFYKLLTKDS